MITRMQQLRTWSVESYVMAATLGNHRLNRKFLEVNGGIIK